MKGFLYKAIQLTWGLPQTVLGLAVFLAHARRPHFRFHGAVATTWESRKAVSLGMFVFLPGPDDAKSARDGVNARLLAHEYGHTIQSLMLGPLYLPVIGLPSLLWLNVPAFQRLRRQRGIPYGAFYTERLANWLAKRFLDE